jgi:NAD(P)-dependent dehydrogenase (short-subunit alcohol dehydrogenase family)
MIKPGFDDLRDKTVVITGGAGVIGSSIAQSLGLLGMKVVILDINHDAAKLSAAKVTEISGSFALGVQANVLDKISLQEAKTIINREAGKIDFLINGAGGNSPKATTAVEEITEESKTTLEQTFYGLEMDGFQKVFDLNFVGTLLPTMVFTTDMLEKGKGAVLNISSLNSFRPLTKIPAYSAAKAAINNFTEWLAVHLAKSGIRVNAVSPGFILTQQNRFLLIDETSGNLKPRGEKIILNTPMGRFGDADELNGAVAYLLSDCSKFVTGTVLLVDGGFNAYSGV